MPDNSITGRGHWSTRFGFILAAAGSAVGLGNIWKFPYITGVYGGGAFVLVYIGCVLLIGLPLMIAELVIGRRAQENPVGAFQKLHREGSPWQGAGWLGVASGFIILSFYSVVAGWTIAFFFKSLVGFSGTAEQIQGQFGELVGNTGASVGWHTLFMALTIGIVLGGIRQGIERWAKILMPALIVLLIGLMFYGLFGTEGGSQALTFLFQPNFSELSAEGVLSALGHAFFTLSLGMGAMITYGSYMGRKARIVRDAVTISFLDTIIALLAGVAIFSLVFAYGLEPSQGPGLIFKTLPVLFADVGPFVSVPFFILLTFAALSSSISLLEVVVSYFIDKRGWSRTKATLLMGGSIYLLGVLCATSSLTLPFRGSSQGFLDIFDFITTNYMLPVGGLLTCLFFAWVVKNKVRSEEFGSSGMLYKSMLFIVRFVTPAAVVIVLLHGVGIITFNNPPVIKGGTLTVEKVLSPTGLNYFAFSADFTDADEPDIEDLVVTFSIRPSGDTTDVLIVGNLKHGSEDFVLLQNEDKSYTAEYFLKPDSEYTIGAFDLYFEVSDGTDTAIDSLTDYLNCVEAQPDTTVSDTVLVE